MESPAEVVAALVALGLDERDAVMVVAEGRVPLALVERLEGTQPTLSAAEVSAATGVPETLLADMQLALGLPADRGYTEEDCEDLQRVAGLVKALPQEALLRTLRTDAQALRRVALNNLELVRQEVLLPMRQEGVDDVRIAVALAEVARVLLPLSPHSVAASYRRILTHLLSTELATVAVRGSDNAIELAVGFVDVVGYTSLSASVDPTGLAEVLEAFEGRCYEAASTDERLRLVKFLGDAAMFVCTDAVVLAEALLDLVAEAAADSPLAEAPMRAGMASGQVLGRGGDYFGPPVNLAARLTDRARAGSLLADQELRAVLTDHFDFHRTSSMSLHGIGRRKPLRVRPLDD